MFSFLNYSNVFGTVADAKHGTLLYLHSRGAWADGDGVTGNGSNSSVPAEESLSTGSVMSRYVAAFCRL